MLFFMGSTSSIRQQKLIFHCYTQFRTCIYSRAARKNIRALYTGARARGCPTRNTRPSRRGCPPITHRGSSQSENAPAAGDALHRTQLDRIRCRWFGRWCSRYRGRQRRGREGRRGCFWKFEYQSERENEILWAYSQLVGALFFLSACAINQSVLGADVDALQYFLQVRL